MGRSYHHSALKDFVYDHDRDGGTVPKTWVCDTFRQLWEEPIAIIICVRSEFMASVECPSEGVAPADAAAFPSLEFFLTFPGFGCWS
jgi:hypothetical protein